MIRLSPATLLALLLGLFLFGATPVHAQPPTPPVPPLSEDDDDARLRPLEPDYTLVNIPTTMPLPVHAGNFHLTHRFNENLRRDSFSTQASNLWGLDEGATIQLEYRFGIMKHLEAIASRTNVDRDIQFSAKYDAFHQSDSRPLGLSGIVSIEGGNNFQTRYTPAIGVILSRTLSSVAAVYIDPIWTHNSLPGSDIVQNTFYVGVGARVRLRPSTFVVGEVSPRVSGHAPGDAEFAFAIEKRVGAHVFSLTFANTQATTYGQLARGGTPETLYLGFNLARKFF